MIEIRCCHDLAEAASLQPAMDALNLASARPDPFSTFGFYDNFLRHAGWPPGDAGPRLWLLLAFRGRELVGYAALKRSVTRVLGLRAARIDWLTAHAADRPHLVTRPEQATRVGAAMLRYLMDRREEWSLLEFQQQEPDSPLVPAAPGLLRVRHWAGAATGRIPVRWTSLAGYLGALSCKARSNVSRQVRTLMGAGEVQVLGSSDPASLPALFELYRDIEPHSWKARAGAGIGHDARSMAYYTGLMDPQQPMRLLILLLLLDGRPIAGLICGAFGRGLYALHMVYDEREARLAPGSALMLMAVRLAIGRNYDFLDLMRGSGYYKERWLAEMRETRSIQAYRIGTPYYWRRVAGDALRGWRRPPAAAPPFNPARRDAGPATIPPSAPAADPGESARHAALVERVKRGAGEFLSATQLAAVLPFETRRRIASGAAAGK